MSTNLSAMILWAISFVCIVFAIQSDLVNSKEVNEIQKNSHTNDLDACYHAERLLRSGISPDLVLRTLEATGQVSKDFRSAILQSTGQHTLERTLPSMIRENSSNKNRKRINLSKQSGTAVTTPLADLPTPLPLAFPESYAVSPNVKLADKLKNKDRSAINTLTDVVTNNANLLQAYPLEMHLDRNKYKLSDVNQLIYDIEVNLSTGLRSGKTDKDKPISDILKRKASTSQASGLCDDFVAQGIRGRNNLLSHILTRDGLKNGVEKSDKKGKNYVNNEGDVIIKSKSVNGKSSNIRNVKDVVLGVSALDESYDILDIMDDDDFKDSKVSTSELFVSASGTVNL